MVIPIVFHFFVIMAVTWFVNNGLNGSVSYFFFLLMTIGILLVQRPFLILIVAIVITLIVLLVVEFYNPTILIDDDNRIQQFLDMGILLALRLVFNGMIIHIVFREYFRERQQKDALLAQANRDKEELKLEQNEIRVLLREVIIAPKIICWLLSPCYICGPWKLTMPERGRCSVIPKTDPGHALSA